jgi:hypothetical protein
MVDIEENIKELLESINSQVTYHKKNRHLYGNSQSEVLADGELHKVYAILLKESNRLIKLNVPLREIEKRRNDDRSRAGNRPH